MAELTTLGDVIAAAVAPFVEAQDSVISRSTLAPPSSPSNGDRYIVPVSASGAWAGRGNRIATRSAGAWSYLVAREGMSLWIDDEEIEAHFDGTTWVIETSGGSGDSTGGVQTRSNKRMTALTTTADGDLAVAVAVTGTPVAGCYVSVVVDGMRISDVGDGTKVGVSCYFSADGGATARTWAAITTGDTCHWNGSVAGFQLAPTDVVEFDYEENS
jgi:hypothetical protein